MSFIFPSYLLLVVRLNDVISVLGRSPLQLPVCDSGNCSGPIFGNIAMSERNSALKRTPISVGFVEGDDAIRCNGVCSVRIVLLAIIGRNGSH